MIEFSSFLSFEKNLNVETFIIIFESMKNLESMIINLVNQSFSHYFIDFHTNTKNQSLNNQIIDHFQINLKNEFFIIVRTDMKNISFDLFAYNMILDHYISEKIYEMMINSNTSTKLIAEYCRKQRYRSRIARSRDVTTVT